ncbi:transposase-like protein [Streptococcus pneumoniae]|nr:transposase-like protein [Streptococcus pneumoniae]
MHLTNKEILDKLLSYSEDLKHHYNLYQLLLFHLCFRLCLKPSSKIKRKSSTPFNYLIPTPNWKPPIISSNLSSTMPLVLGTLKTSKKKGRNLSFLPNHSYLSQLDVTYKTPDLMSHFLPPHEVSFTFCCSSIVFPR